MPKTCQRPTGPDTLTGAKNLTGLETLPGPKFLTGPEIVKDLHEGLVVEAEVGNETVVSDALIRLTVLQRIIGKNSNKLRG
jgi:hypothetical protein